MGALIFFMTIYFLMVYFIGKDKWFILLEKINTNFKSQESGTIFSRMWPVAAVATENLHLLLMF